MKNIFGVAVIIMFFGVSGIFVYFAGKELSPADSSASIIAIRKCQRVEYGDWGQCINGERFRNVSSVYPEGCDIMERVVTTLPCSEDGIIKYCLNNSECSSTENCNKDLCLNPCGDQSLPGECLTVCYGKCELISGETTPTPTSPTVTPTEQEGPISLAIQNSCGLVDANTDGQINIVDLDIFVKKYGSKCIKAIVSNTSIGCGYTDFNNDGIINIVDFDNFVKLFGSKQCLSV